MSVNLIRQAGSTLIWQVELLHASREIASARDQAEKSTETLRREANMREEKLVEELVKMQVRAKTHQVANHSW